MKFFVPHTPDEARAREKFERIRKLAVETTGWEVMDRKIFSLDFVARSKKYHSQVGDIDEIAQEKVGAILESDTYLICTPNRGILRGTPIRVGKEKVSMVVDFE